MTLTLTHDIEAAFTCLADKARRHHDLQRSGASIAELWQSRRDLDEARLEAAQAKLN